MVVVPVPFAGTPVIHAGAPLLVQLQLAAVFTSNVLAPPAAAALWLVGFNEKLHAAAACVTAKVWPPMVMLALREAGSGLAATVKLIVVVPVPLGGTPVIHAGTPLVVQAQLAAVLTSNELAPPAAAALWLVGFNEKLHAAAACVTAKVWPPMVMLALREAGSGLAATVKLMVVVPVPLGGTAVIHAGTPLLVQAQLAAVFTSNELAPPAAAALWLVGFNEKLHAAAACVTAKVWPPMVMLALREAGSGLAATVKLMVVVPVPLGGTPVIHAGTPLLVQAQLDAVLTANVLAPPAADALWLVGFNEKLQRRCGLRHGEGLAADGDVGTARSRVRIGGDGEIDRRRTGSAGWYSRDPRRHAAAGPGAAGCGVHVERA